jgi:hypothetical protein
MFSVCISLAFLIAASLIAIACMEVFAVDELVAGVVVAVLLVATSRVDVPVAVEGKVVGVVDKNEAAAEEEEEEETLDCERN